MNILHKMQIVPEGLIDVPPDSPVPKAVEAKKASQVLFHCILYDEV